VAGREKTGRLVALLLALAAAALVLLRLAAPAAGPVEPAWDRVACARCGMLVSDPAFAAQLQGGSGEVLFFDDPGCLLLERAESAEPHARAWFHEARASRWLADAEVGFVRADPTPMGHGLRAVARADDPSALSPEAALAVLAFATRAAP